MLTQKGVIFLNSRNGSGVAQVWYGCWKLALVLVLLRVVGRILAAEF